jgi:hypothetical protein
MIEAPAPVELAAARPENEHGSVPLTPTRFVEQPLHVVGADRSFQAVQNDKNRSSGRSIQVMHDQGILVGCLQALDSCIVDALAAKKLSP